MGSVIDENQSVLLLDIQTSESWRPPDATLAPEATKHHAEILVGENGINLYANRYLLEDCPM